MGQAPLRSVTSLSGLTSAGGSPSPLSGVQASQTAHPLALGELGFGNVGPAPRLLPPRHWLRGPGAGPSAQPPGWRQAPRAQFPGVGGGEAGASGRRLRGCSGQERPRPLPARSGESGVRGRRGEGGGVEMRTGGGRVPWSRPLVAFALSCFRTLCLPRCKPAPYPLGAEPSARTAPADRPLHLLPTGTRAQHVPPPPRPWRRVNAATLLTPWESSSNPERRHIPPPPSEASHPHPSTPVAIPVLHANLP